MKQTPQGRFWGAFFTWIPVAVLLAAFLLLIREDLKKRSSYWRAPAFTETDTRIRQMPVSPAGLHALKELCNLQSRDWIPVLTAVMLDQGRLDDAYTEGELSIAVSRLEGYRTIHPEAFARAENFYRQIYTDLVCFPVQDPVTYENSWMFERNFGGRRGHEGTDLFPAIQKSNFYPVRSMTDGIVEAVGWLTRGGYRIGIRASCGGYFYYAHLSAYARAFQEGEAIQAGEVLGFMGDTGYGEEGTTGQFPVHLHVGIYIQTAENPEISVNPYPVLKYLEDVHNF